MKMALEAVSVQRVFSLLAPRTQPKFAAALRYEPQTWCTSRPDGTNSSLFRPLPPL